MIINRIFHIGVISLFASLLCAESVDEKWRFLGEMHGLASIDWPQALEEKLVVMGGFDYGKLTPPWRVSPGDLMTEEEKRKEEERFHRDMEMARDDPDAFIRAPAHWGEVGSGTVVNPHRPPMPEPYIISVKVIDEVWRNFEVGPDAARFIHKWPINRMYMEERSLLLSVYNLYPEFGAAVIPRMDVFDLDFERLGKFLDNWPRIGDRSKLEESWRKVLRPFANEVVLIPFPEDWRASVADALEHGLAEDSEEALPPVGEAPFLWFLRTTSEFNEDLLTEVLDHGDHRLVTAVLARLLVDGSHDTQIIEFLRDRLKKNREDATFHERLMDAFVVWGFSEKRGREWRVRAFIYFTNDSKVPEWMEDRNGSIKRIGGLVVRSSPIPQFYLEFLEILDEYEAGQLILSETREFLLEIGAKEPREVLRQRIDDLLASME